ACSHECDGLWLGVDGRNGHRHLADGPIVPDGPAISATPGCGRWILEFGGSAGRWWDCSRRQHRLSMARVSALRSDHSFCRLHAHCLMGGTDVSLSARRTNLHYPMVSARRVSLVSVALCGWPVDALRRAGAGRLAIGGRLVVRK